MTQASLEAFRRLVLDNLALQGELRDLSDRAKFTERMQVLARTYGYDITADDVVNALQASRRSWIERWTR